LVPLIVHAPPSQNTSSLGGLMQPDTELLLQERPLGGVPAVRVTESGMHTQEPVLLRKWAVRVSTASTPQQAPPLPPEPDPQHSGSAARTVGQPPGAASEQDGTASTMTGAAEPSVSTSREHSTGEQQSLLIDPDSYSSNPTSKLMCPGAAPPISSVSQVIPWASGGPSQWQAGPASGLRRVSVQSPL
jgi:hypothetical protein